MSAAKSRFAYTDCYDLFDRAMETSYGIQRFFDDYGAAMQFRTRLHMARTLDQNNNREVYSPGDPLYGQTVYASIRVRGPNMDHERGKWVVRMEKIVLGEGDVEEIPPPQEVGEEIEEGEDGMAGT